MSDKLLVKYIIDYLKDRNLYDKVLSDMRTELIRSEKEVVSSKYLDGTDPKEEIWFTLEEKDCYYYYLKFRFEDENLNDLSKYNEIKTRLLSKETNFYKNGTIRYYKELFIKENPTFARKIVDRYCTNYFDFYQFFLPKENELIDIEINEVKQQKNKIEEEIKSLEEKSDELSKKISSLETLKCHNTEFKYLMLKLYNKEYTPEQLTQILEIMNIPNEKKEAEKGKSI